MNEKIAIMGLGYVGLRYSQASSNFEVKVLYFKKRITDLKKGIDETLEVKSSQLKNALKI